MTMTTANREMEALVDLFLSPSFHPFELEDQLPGRFGGGLVACGPRFSRILEGSHGQTVPHFCSNVIMEAEVADGFDEVIDYRLPTTNDVIPTSYRPDVTTLCGQKLARMGDDFFKSYVPREIPSSAAGKPWLSVSENLKSALSKAAQLNDKDPNYEQEKEKAWSEFKEIMSRSVSDTVVSDVYKQLGALLLTLHGLSNIGAGVAGLARSFFLRYIRDRHLDAEIQRLGGLNRLASQEVD